jgi:hypothetical protein
LQWNSDHQSNPYPIAFSHSPNQIRANIDQKLFWHLFNNLVGSAIKYSPVGSPVQVRLSSTDQAVHFEIQDQGIGILPEDLKDLFQPFRRGGNVGKLPGTGLGLAIAKRAIELHGGEITVESQVGQGTTFTVRLPLQLSRREGED